MSGTEEKLARRKLSSTYLSTVISVSLVLFMLGLLGLIILNAKKLSDYMKENIAVKVIIKDDAKEGDVARLQKELDAAAYVKSAEFITKEQAAATLQEDLGEDFIDFLGYNPLLPSIEVKFKADYANQDSIAKIESELARMRAVKEIYYKKSLVGAVNENAQKISLVILGFSVLLLLIAIGLINNSIRLSIYSRRFLIRTMLLVGATHGFIRWPFVWRGIRHGIYGAIVAIAFLSFVLYFANKHVPDLIGLLDMKMVATLFAGVLILGVLITGISTSLAVRKYLRLKADQLYF